MTETARADLPDFVRAYAQDPAGFRDLPRHEAGPCDDCQDDTTERWEYGWVWARKPTWDAQSNRYVGGEKRGRLTCKDCTTGRLRRANRPPGPDIADPEPFAPPTNVRTWAILAAQQWTLRAVEAQLRDWGVAGDMLLELVDLAADTQRRSREGRDG